MFRTLHGAQLNRIEAKLDLLLRGAKIMAGVVSQNFKDLQGEISQDIAVDTSVLKLQDGIITALENAIGQHNTGDTDALPTLVATLKANRQANADAVAAGLTRLQAVDPTDFPPPVVTGTGTDTSTSTSTDTSTAPPVVTGTSTDTSTGQ